MSIRAARVPSGERERTSSPRGSSSGTAWGRDPASLGNRATLQVLGRPTSRVVQRASSCCDGKTDDTCSECAAREHVVQRCCGSPGCSSAGSAGAEPSPEAVTGAVASGVASPAAPLDEAVRSELEPRFGHDLGAVRLHSGTQAAASAQDVGALAYTVGHDIVFASGRYAPHTAPGRRLLAHELAHVVQQSTSAASIARSPTAIAPASGLHERQADAASDAALAGGRVPALAPMRSVVARRAAPYIKRVRVDLAPPQNAELEWEGEPPTEATGSDQFTVSTGKGYSNSEDPAGTCTRDCCTDANTQCAPPWNRPDKVGACCTYIGSTFWTGKPRVEHNGWKWWTPIEPYYNIRGIALHQHDEVTGRPIGHGCVRMADENARRIFDYSNGRRTNVTIGGRAAPVACDEDRKCAASPGKTGADRGNAGTGPRLAATPPVPGLEGRMT